MISIIISSADKILLEQASKDIDRSIGVPYEIICFDNRKGEKGICSIYNQGAIQAKYELLCFMHEDIEFKTNNWGKIVNEIFSIQQNIGLLGVVGSSYKCLAPSGWQGLGAATYYSNLVQGFKHVKSDDLFYYRNPRNEPLTDVVCLDGVWFCTTKKIALENKFDESFKGFHVYDIDFSLSISRQYRVVVTYDILMRHFSEGSYNRDWLLDTIQLHLKWNDLLPIDLEKIEYKSAYRLEKNTFKRFIDNVLKYDVPIKFTFMILWYKKKFLKMGMWLFLKLHFYIFLKSVLYKIRF